MLPDKIIQEVIKQFPDKINPENLYAAQTATKKTGRQLEEILLTDNLLDENEIYEKAGEILNVPFIGLKGREIKKETLNLNSFQILLQKIQSMKH